MTASNILETTDWSHLLHACGTAEGAVPALKTLQGEDPDAMTQAVDVLEPCFLRQSTPYPATPAALRYVLAVLAEWGAERAGDESLADVAENLSIFVRNIGFLLRRCEEDLAGRAVDERAAQRARELLDERPAATGDGVWQSLGELRDPLIYNAGLELMALAPEVLDVLVPRVPRPDGRIDLETLDTVVPWLVLPGADDARTAVLAEVCDRLDGLDPADRAMLEKMYDTYGDRPVGLTTIAALTGDEATTIEDFYEPYLLQIGFIERTPRGRRVTPQAITHIKQNKRAKSAI